ncbi:MAG: hypothetical protein ABW221_26480 [Vicinamibacteria bacterium]
MTALMNELLEEGVTRSQELTDAADEALHGIDQVAESATELTRRLEDESRDAGQRMRDLAARLAEATGTLETARTRAEHGLEGVTTAAGALKAAAADLLARVRESLDLVETKAEEVDTALDADWTGAKQGFQETARSTVDAGEQVGLELEQIGQALTALQAAVTTAHDEFDGKREAWSQALDALVSNADAQADGWTNALDALLERHGGAVVQLTNGMIDLHNEAMEEARRRFVDQAPADLAAALQPVEDGLARLGQEAAQLSQDLGHEATSLEQRASDTLPELANLQAALDAAGHVG